MSLQLDQVTGLWLPDTNYVFGSDIDTYELEDTRYFHHDLRLMLTTNKIHPKCYKVTKVTDLAPKGLLKCTLKQDEYDELKDNVNLLVCDFYDDDGDINVEPVFPDVPDATKTSTISWARGEKDEDNEKKIEVFRDDTIEKSLKIGEVSYFIADFSDDEVSHAEWRVSYVNVTAADENMKDERKQYYCDLLKISAFGENVIDGKTVSSISIRPNKVKSLKGKKFSLSVQDHNGEYESSIELEVTA